MQYSLLARAPSVFFVAFVGAACISIAGCGSAESGGSGSDNDAATSPATEITVDVPATLQAVAGDLTEPEQWLGHTYRADSMAAPFQKVFLDGRDTGYVTMSIGCGFDGVLLPTCPALVRLDDVGDGDDIGGAGDWMVLTYQPGQPPDSGIVIDAVAATTTEAGLLMMANCWAADGSDGVYFGFGRFNNPTYQPVGDPEADAAATPMVQAWQIVDGSRLVDVPAEAVRCNNYSWGD